MSSPFTLRNLVIAALLLVLALVTGAGAADSAGPALASMLIYILMAAVLVVKPQGLFPAGSR